MTEISVIYVGPLASGRIESRYNDTVIEFVNGEPVKVDDWVAKGHPGEPGTCEVDGKAEEFTGSPPVGSVVLEDPIPPLGGLLDQPDNWQLATPGKEKKTPPKSDPDNPKDEG